jgi:hypothetical protein
MLWVRVPPPELRSRRAHEVPMKLFVCYGTWKPAPRPGGHPYHPLRDEGDVISGSEEITDWATGHRAAASVGAAG